MIELTFNTLFILYLGLTLTSVLGIWIFSHYQTRHKTILSTEQDLRICEYCHFAYVEDSVKHLNRCPQCGLFNKNNTYHQMRQKKES